MKTIYTTDLVSKPETKKIIDDFIKFPISKDKPNLIIDKNIDYDNASLGNAVEILFHLLVDNNQNSFFPPLKSYEFYLLRALSECKQHGYNKIDDFYIRPYVSGLLVYPNIRYLNDDSFNDLIKVKVKDMLDDFYSAIEVLADKTCFEKNIDNAMFSILIIANILPLCKRFMMFNSNYKKINLNTIINLKKVFEHFPTDFINIDERIITEPSINIGRTNGRPDFVIGETLLEIKSTQVFLTKDHLRQVALYYLGLTENNRHSIKEVAIYYSLYGKTIKFKVEEIFNLKNKRIVLKKLNNYD